MRAEAPPWGSAGQAAALEALTSDLLRASIAAPCLTLPLLLASRRAQVNPAKCCVVEDSRIGMQAAKAAGMTCVITKSSYTAEENFDVADAIFDCIGEAGQERFSLKDLSALLDKKAKVSSS